MRKGVKLREETCLGFLKIHGEKPSHYAPEPCQCPWCRRARKLIRERDLG